MFENILLIILYC